MKWLPAVAAAIIVVALAMIGQMYFAIRGLERTEQDLRDKVNSLGLQYDALQQQMMRLASLPKPELVSYAQAEMDFAKFVDELRKAGVGVTEVTPPRVEETSESPTLGEEVEKTPTPKGFNTVVGMVRIAGVGSFDEILSLLAHLQENRRLLRFSTIEAKSGRAAGQYFLTIEALYAVETQGGG